MIRSIQFAWRVIARRKSFSAVVIFTMAVGIGASTSIFSFVNGILLQPLPFPEADQLYIIESIKSGEPGRLSQRELQDIKERTTIFEDVAGYNPAAQYNLTKQGEPEEIPTTICSQNLFSVLGIGMIQGTSWPEEFDGRRAFGIVLTEELWKRKFNSDRTIINGTITLDAYDGYTVFGVMPEGFDFPKGQQMFRSASWFDAQVVDRNFRDRIGLGRMRKDLTPEQASHQLQKLANELQNKFPETNSSISFRIQPLTDLYVGPIRPYLLLLSIAVLVVLIIACINVSNLLLAAGADRDKEVAIRTVIGARQTTIIQQFVIESLMLSLLGGLLGIAFAYGLLNSFTEILQTDLPHWMHVQIDTNVLLFTLLITLSAGIVAGLAPSFKLSSLNVARLIKESKGTSGGKHRHQMRRALVVLELSLSVVLMVGTVLLLKSFDNLQRKSLGFNPDNIYTYRVALPWRKYTREDGPVFYRQLLAELKSIPGVERVALNDNLPLSYQVNNENRDSEFTIDGQSFEEQKQNPYAKYQVVSHDYFELMEIQLLKGRYLNAFDDTLTTPVAVINENMAKSLFAGEDPIGKKVKFGKPDSPSLPKTIVGIVSDVLHDDIRSSGGYHIYLSIWQVPEVNQFVLIKSNNRNDAFAALTENAVKKVDGEQSIYDARWMGERVDNKLWQDKLVRNLFLIFAVIAILLATVGIYSVMSYAVSQRTKEFGIRRVLGAKTTGILGMVLLEVSILSTVSVIIGLVTSVLLNDKLSQFVFNVEILDPKIYLLVIGFIFLISLVAAFAPAYKATLINPVNALKNE